MMFFTVEPAYGRKYKTVAEAQKDWEANKDFKVMGGPYINKSDREQYAPGSTINLYFGEGQYERLV